MKSTMYFFGIKHRKDTLNFSGIKKIIILIVVIIVQLSCTISSTIQDSSLFGGAEFSPGTLLFNSGFEGNTFISEYENDFAINNWPDYSFIRGEDTITGFSWPIQILGSNFGGIHKVNDDGGAIENAIETVIGPDGEETQALFQKVNYDVQLTQTPYEIDDITRNPEELYISYYMKTDNTSLKGPNKWRAIWEYKTINYGLGDDGFRMIALMATDEYGTPIWVFQGDLNPSNAIWRVENYNIPVIMNEWFKVEYYIKWSDTSEGYAAMKVNGQLIGEHYGPTTRNSDNLDFIILTQVYGNTHPMHQWVDDIEIWDGKPN